MTEILATEATLSTLKVEIKALTVSGKQMTLAVFRQLPEAESIDNLCRLQDGVTYWGQVRYSIKDEGDLWAVMERDGQLFRGRILLRDSVCRHYISYTGGMRWTDGRVPSAMEPLFDQINELDRPLDFEKWCKAEGIDYRETRYANNPARCRFEKEEEERKLRFARLLAEFDHARPQYAQWLADSIRTLSELPQLYIAV